MCHIITAILPPQANEKALRELFSEHGRSLDLDNRPDERVDPWMKQGEHRYFTTRGFCDCGTALVSLAEGVYAQRNSEERLAKQVEKLKKKGWSQHKINAWLSQKRETREKLAEAKEHKANHDGTREIGHWHSLLNDAIQQRLSPYVALLVLWDGQDTVLKGRTEKKIASMQKDDLMKLDENTIYTFS